MTRLKFNGVIYTIYSYDIFLRIIYVFWKCENEVLYHKTIFCTAETQYVTFYQVTYCVSAVQKIVKLDRYIIISSIIIQVWHPQERLLYFKGLVALGKSRYNGSTRV